jgi:arginase family enzyme
VLGGDHTITWPDVTGVARVRAIAVELPVVGMDVVEV